jgi:hypothetical protein
LLPLPTESQTYMAPVLLTIGGQTDVIVGTGGEKHGGQLFRIPLSAIVKGNLDGIVILEADTAKGFIQSPILADVNDDGVKDILASNLNESIYAINGSDNSRIWKVVVEQFEMYAGLTAGYFNSDNVVDLSVNVGEGVWPYYSGFQRFILDGKTGIRTPIDNISGYLDISGGSSYWSDQNPGQDILVYSRNIYNEDEKRLEVMRYQDEDLEMLLSMENQTIVGGFPVVGDLDSDGNLDLLVLASDYEGGFGSVTNRSILTRIDLGDSGGTRWSGYMGNETNAHWEDKLISGVEHWLTSDEIEVYPNPFTDRLTLTLNELQGLSKSGSWRMIVYQSNGSIIMDSNIVLDDLAVQIDTRSIKNPGTYILLAISPDGYGFRKVIIKAN